MGDALSVGSTAPTAWRDRDGEERDLLEPFYVAVFAVLQLSERRLDSLHGLPP